MNYPITFLLLLASTCVRAQKMDVVERETDSGYTFTVSADRLDRTALNAAFADIAETEVNPGFKGDWSTGDVDGIKYSMDTREAFISISYRGSDPAIIERAKAKAATVRDWLDLPAPPHGANEPPRMPPGRTMHKVEESEAEGSYTFRISLKNDPGQQLVACANRLIDGTLQLKKRGRIMTGIDECSQLSIDNRRHTLTIEHLNGGAAERERIKAFTSRISQCITSLASPGKRS